MFRIPAVQRPLSKRYAKIELSVQPQTSPCTDTKKQIPLRCLSVSHTCAPIQASFSLRGLGTSIPSTSRRQLPEARSDLCNASEISNLGSDTCTTCPVTIPSPAQDQVQNGASPKGAQTATTNGERPEMHIRIAWVTFDTFVRNAQQRSTSISL